MTGDAIGLWAIGIYTLAAIANFLAEEYLA